MRNSENSGATDRPARPKIKTIEYNHQFLVLLFRCGLLGGGPGPVDDNSVDFRFKEEFIGASDAAVAADFMVLPDFFGDAGCRMGDDCVEMPFCIGSDSDDGVGAEGVCMEYKVPGDELI